MAVTDNDLSPILPKIIARGLLVLRKKLIMPLIVNGDFSAEAAQKGDTIDVPIAGSKSASDVNPSNVHDEPSATTLTKVPITLDNWKKTDFYLDDKDLTNIDRDDQFIPMEMDAAINGIAEEINTDLFDEYTAFYGFAGTPGTTPFTNDISDATDLTIVLNNQKAPKQNRRVVLDFNAEAQALQLAPFRDASQSGDSNVILEGEIGRKLGYDWFSDHDVPTHTAGTPGGTPVVNGAHLAGVTTVAIDGLTVTTGDYHKGDIITFAGDSQTYVVGADVTANGSGEVDVAIDPPLVVALDGEEAVSLKADHVVNLAIHRDAIAFAMRPLFASTQDLALGSQMASLTDPQTGISLRLEVKRLNKLVTWEFDALWGAKAIRPALGARLAG